MSGRFSKNIVNVGVILQARGLDTATMEQEIDTKMLAPAVASLRSETGGHMQRSLSEDIREERQDLREAAEQTLNVIMDLGLDGVIRWVSPSWTDVIGTSLDSVQAKAIVDILIGDNKDAFKNAMDSMKKDDSRSQIVRFTVELGLASKLAVEEAQENVKEPGSDAEPQTAPATIDLEGQGIMVYDRSSGGESHVCTGEINKIAS